MKLNQRQLRLALILGFIFIAAWGFAQSAAKSSNITVPSINIGLGGAKGGDDLSTTLQILAMLTILSVAPSILILTTAFTRIVIILSLLRTALGTQNIPPNPILIGLSMFLSFYVMAPTYEQINNQALQPYMKKQITLEQALPKAEQPIKKFMLRNTYKKDLELFLKFRNETAATPEDVKLVSLIPAFVISELKTAFVIGFYIFLPFVVIDLVIASVLMSMGMMMMPPVVISMPAKLLVFVLADGWSVLVKAILAGYF